MDLDKTETDSDGSLSEDSLEVSDHVSSLVRSPRDKISCALCVSRNKGNSMETVRSFARDSQETI